MCGIIGVLSRRPSRPVPTQDDILGLLDSAIAALEDPVAMAAAASHADALLRGLPGVQALADRSELITEITHRLDRLDAATEALERSVEHGVHTPDELELRNAEVIALRDVLWTLRHDRLRTADEVALLAGRDAGE